MKTYRFGQNYRRILLYISTRYGEKKIKLSIFLVKFTNCGNKPQLKKDKIRQERRTYDLIPLIISTMI